MKFKEPKNINYVATVVKIKNVITIPGMDRIQHTNIFGNLVIISKEINVGDKGIIDLESIDNDQ